jgi:hypothetical protein
MRTAIDTIAIEMMVPADEVLLLRLLGSMEGVDEAADDLLADAVADFDAEGLGEVRVLVGATVGVDERDGRAATTTVPLMPAWIEQWYVKEPARVKV